MGESSAIAYIGADDIRFLLPSADAVQAIEAALREGLNPADDLARTPTKLRHGQFLLMPSEIRASAGVKIVTVAPDNPKAGLPLVHAMYVLFDARTLVPRAILDGTALTTLRTPAVSLAAVKLALQRSSAPLQAVFFGGGPQAVGHAKTVTAVLKSARRVSKTTFVVRRPDAYTQLAAEGADVVAVDSEESLEAVRRAGLVVCATTSGDPLFDSALIRNDAVVIAVGSYQPDAREVDSRLCGRAQVVVEDVDTALRESGDIVLAIKDGAIRQEQLVPMREIVLGRVAPASDRPIFFKGSGMSWQDLVVAEEIFSRFSAKPG